MCAISWSTLFCKAFNLELSFFASCQNLTAFMSCGKKRWWFQWIADYITLKLVHLWCCVPCFWNYSFQLFWDRLCFSKWHFYRKRKSRVGMEITKQYPSVWCFFFHFILRRFSLVNSKWKATSCWVKNWRSYWKTTLNCETVTARSSNAVLKCTCHPYTMMILPKFTESVLASLPPALHCS